MKRLITALLFFVMVSTGTAQTESKRIADQIAPLLSENVFLVAHVDLEKLDIEKIDATFRPVFLSSCDAYYSGWSDEQKKSVPQQLDRAKAAAGTFLMTAKSVFGVRDVYFLGLPDMLPAGFGIVAVSVKNQQAADAIVNTLKLVNTRKIGDFLLIAQQNYPGGKENELLLERFRKRMEQQKPTPRPELQKALEFVENSAAQVVLIPPKYFERVLNETMDKLPPPLEKQPVSLLTRGLHWAALGANFEKMELNLIVQSEQEQAAKDFREALDTILVFSLDKAKNNSDYQEFLEITGMKHEEFCGIARSFLPGQQGDRLVLTISEPFVREKGKRLIEIPAAMIEGAKVPARRMQCVNNLKQLGLALHNYHDTHNQLPPAYTVDRQGKPMHSWRVLLLPFMDQAKLYEKIRLNEPWDSEWNKQFHTQCPSAFQCPQAAARNPDIAKNGLTTYSVIVGIDAFPEKGKSLRFAMITDGLSNTIAVVERKTPVCWMDPTQEIPEDIAVLGMNKNDAGLGMLHEKGSNILRFDGSTYFITETIGLERLKAAITRNGGESVKIEN